MQLSPPGVQDPEEAGQIAADVFGIVSQFFYGARRRSEQCCVTYSLMAANKAPDLLRHGESDHKVMSGQLSFYLFVQPLPGFMVLAVWAVPVAARTIDDMVLAACFTGVDGCAVIIRSTVDDCVNDLSVFAGHVITETGHILRSESLEDFFNCIHGHLLSSGR